MDSEKNIEILRRFYNLKGLTTNFEKDNEYLENAFNKITDIWFDNLAKIREVKYLMIAEAPLWGKKESYIYNPDTPNTQFFHKTDLECVLKNITISDKRDFINRCNEIGLLIIDISPFALNTEDTIINYRLKSRNNPNGMTKNEYRQLIKDTIPTFFEDKIKAVEQRKSDKIKVFFRYARVKDTFQDIVSNTLINYNLIKSKDDILEISQQGGGIDRRKFMAIINPEKMALLWCNKGYLEQPCKFWNVLEHVFARCSDFSLFFWK